MTLDKLIAIASAKYPDGYVKECYDAVRNGESDGLGDGLARFIAFELLETYDPESTTLQQLAEAARVMNAASNELHNVSRELTHRLILEAQK